jgi:hypothetical protein
MKRRWLGTTIAAVVMAISAVFAGTAHAQVYTGRIDVTAVDSTGAVVPGVTVEISGGQKAMSVTDARGEAHFLGLAPGKYAVIAKLSGFGDYKNDTVQVGAGASATLRATMSVGGVTASETVKAETPMLDTRKKWCRPASRSMNCRRFRRRAIRGSCCRPCRASSSTA